MIDFTRRASPCELPELMDGVCTYQDFRDCMRSLQQVNRMFMGYRPTLRWLGRLPRNLHRPLHILDVGSGGGDLLRQIAAWAKRQGIAVQLTGIDLNPYAARAASEFTPTEMDITWITGDALVYQPETPVDILVSSLMAHHLEDPEIVALLRWMEATAQVGWFFNDLERSPRTATLFALAARVMRWHRFVLHDGPVSFRRAFRKDDWLRLLAAAHIPQASVTVEHHRPGRLCVGRWK
jgi:2-polyprenyl-3-methyl-5-hydroxy-6-metoxy-1,4-benzoquinol methylase